MLSTGPSKLITATPATEIVSPAIINELKKKLTQRSYQFPKDGIGAWHRLIVQNDTLNIIVCPAVDKNPKVFVLSPSEPLGEGAQGKVVLAQNLYDNTLVAVKVQDSRNLAFDLEVGIERRNLERCNRLISTADVSKEGIHYAFTFMNYYPGINLLDFLYEINPDEAPDSVNYYGKKRVLLMPQKIRLLSLMLEALIELHEFGLAHRDLKPQNIVLNTKGFTLLWRKLWIVDLGSAIQVETIRTKTIGGTFGYVPPECNDPETAPFYDFLCDYYSLGILACEVLTSTHYQSIIRNKLATIKEQGGFVAGITQEELESYFPEIFSTELKDLISADPSLNEIESDYVIQIILFIRKLCEPQLNREARGDINSLKAFLTILRANECKTMIERGDHTLHRGSFRSGRMTPRTAPSACYTSSSSSSSSSFSSSVSFTLPEHDLTQIEETHVPNPVYLPSSSSSSGPASPRPSRSESHPAAIQNLIKRVGSLKF